MKELKVRYATCQATGPCSLAMSPAAGEPSACCLQVLVPGLLCRCSDYTTAGWCQLVTVQQVAVALMAQVMGVTLWHTDVLVT